MMQAMSSYVHGYGTPEQERLVQQAEHWRHRLIRDGTQLEPGTRLLEVGCGVGAVLAVLGQEFPDVRLTGVDIEPKQLEFARGAPRPQRRRGGSGAGRCACAAVRGASPSTTSG
jgi:cyclopropane fatty-acyl-phospholipid synthase-like methyltransferase